MYGSCTGIIYDHILVCKYAIKPQLISNIQLALYFFLFAYCYLCIKNQERSQIVWQSIMSLQNHIKHVRNKNYREKKNHHSPADCKYVFKFSAHLKPSRSGRRSKMMNYDSCTTSTRTLSWMVRLIIPLTCLHLYNAEIMLYKPWKLTFFSIWNHHKCLG